MTDRTDLKVGGAVIFWSLSGSTSRQELYDSMVGIGLGAFAPEKRPLTAVLKDAMDNSVGGPRLLVRPLQKRDGFALVEERHVERSGQPTLTHHTILTARLEGDPNSPWLNILPSHLEEADKIRAAFSEERDLLRPAQVGGLLTKIVIHLAGTALRPMGGIYWLPDDKLETWTKAAACVEKAAVRGKTSCYTLRHQIDADAVRAVRDAIVTEVTNESERLHREIMAGDLGGRAIEARRKQSDLLRDKLGLYEMLLDVGLTDVRQMLAKVEEAAAAAVILLAGKSQVA